MYKIIIKRLTIVSPLKVFQVLYFFNIHANSDANFSSNILDLYLDFTIYATENVDSLTQVVPNILKFF